MPNFSITRRDLELLGTVKETKPLIPKASKA
jgi:hypothetical protein